MRKGTTSMKKILIIICLLFIFTGCTKKQKNTEEINFNNINSQEERYEYEHGIVNYQFEQWNYNGNKLNFNYNISNQGKKCEFGLIFLIDGIPQEYSINGKKTSMYTFNMKSNETQILSIEMMPKINTKKSQCNFNAFLILNPSTHIKDIKQYGHNHSISSAPTVSLIMDKHSIDEKIQIENIKYDYEDIPSQILNEYLKDGTNILESNIYIERNLMNDEDGDYLYKEKPLQLKAYGKQGKYRILEFRNNSISHMYNVVVKREKYSNIVLKTDFNKNDNVYFLIVPLDSQDPYDYIMINQSERWIVK